MTDATRRGAGPRTARRLAMVAAAVALLAACDAAPSASPSVPPSMVPGSPTPTLVASQPATSTPQPTATPEPELSLDLPGSSDQRTVRVTAAPQVGEDGGELVVTVENLSEERVVELVLRWPTELDDTLFLAPFEPSEQRIANGGPPLLQDWTKWVVGPGERGEPAGTTSLGWGPLDGGATLTIPVQVTRRTSGPVAFDLQVLAGEAILTLEDGSPAELRVEVP